jgi:hypothetical protein
MAGTALALGVPRAGRRVQENGALLRIGLRRREGTMREDQIGLAFTNQLQAMPTGNARARRDMLLRRLTIGVCAASLQGAHEPRFERDKADGHAHFL